MTIAQKLLAAALVLFAITTAEPAAAARCKGVKCLVFGAIVDHAAEKLGELLERIRERRRQRDRLNRCLPSHVCPLSGPACRAPPIPPQCANAGTSSVTPAA